jgi:hypothetical protein
MAGFADAEKEAPAHRVGLACATPKRDTPVAEHLAEGLSNKSLFSELEARFTFSSAKKRPAK